MNKHIALGVAAAAAGSTLLAALSGAASAAEQAGAEKPARAVSAHVGELRVARLHVGPRLATSLPRNAAIRPVGRRMQVIGERRNLVESGNWSGYGGIAPAGRSFQGAEGSWTVPAVKSTPAGYSSSWVGVDGFDNTDLIQTGTAQDTRDGYWAWYEILPQQADVIGDASGPAPVSPGDKMIGSVEATSTPGQWTIYLADSTKGWYFQQNFTYNGPGTSVEWIEEAPQVNGAQSTPDNFGTVHFSQTAVWANSQTQPFSTDLTPGNAIAMVSRTHILAMPGHLTAPGTSGQAFTVTYVHKPGIPRDLRAAAGVKAVRLTWSAPITDGGMRITNYRLREYKNGRLVRKWTVGSATSVTVKSLTAGAAYNFQVAAVNGGGWTGQDTKWSGRVRPRS